MSGLHNEPQSIDTAPKDKKILVFNVVTGWYFSHWVKKEHLNFENGEFPYYGWSHINGSLKGGDNPIGTWYPRPTHWMPEPDYAVS